MARTQRADTGLAGRLAAALAACALLAAPANAAEAPLSLATRGVPVVEVAINGKGPFAMVLDTGAGLTTVTTSLRRELGLMKLGRMPQPVQLADGPATVDIYTLGFVAVAGEPAPAPITLILDAPLARVPEARGILGMNVLSRFAVEIDQPGRRLALHPRGDGPRPGADWHEAAMARRADYFVIVAAEIDGVAASAVIDTGANVTILNPALGEALGIVADAPGVARGELGVGGTATLKARASRLSVAGIDWRTPEVQAADLPLFAALGLADRPALILGNDALTEVRLFIDYAGGRLYLAPPGTAAAAARDVR